MVGLKCIPHIRDSSLGFIHLCVMLEQGAFLLRTGELVNYSFCMLKVMGCEL